MGRMNQVKVPKAIDFREVPGLTKEAVEKLSMTRPETIGRAAEVPGMTPAALVNLGFYVQALKRRAKR
jgi:tRNA uridine 5-carboxymethylaminomethyl modification enzyme